MKYLLLVAILAGACYAKFLENNLITEEIIRRSLEGKLSQASVEREINGMLNGYTFSLLIRPIVFFLQILLVSVITFVAFETAKYKGISFYRILHKAVLASIIFLLSDFLKVIILSNTEVSLTLRYLKFYEPGSILDIFPIDELNPSMVILGTKVNLGYFIFLFVYSKLISYEFENITFETSSKIVITSLGSLYLLYVLTITFLFTIV
jgi:hypothetical protein